MEGAMKIGFQARVLMVGVLATAAVACGVPQVPAGGPAQVRFASDDSGAYDVRVTDAAGATAECHTPCTLNVTSGTADIQVNGAAQYATKAVVPPGSSDGTVKRQNKSLAGLSYTLLGGSLVLGFAAALLHPGFEGTIALASGSGVLALASLPATLGAGNNEVAVRGNTQGAQGSQTSLVPRVAVDLSPERKGAALGWSF
jgi:hypothetical protein